MIQFFRTVWVVWKFRKLLFHLQLYYFQKHKLTLQLFGWYVCGCPTASSQAQPQRKYQTRAWSTPGAVHRVQMRRVHGALSRRADFVKKTGRETRCAFAAGARGRGCRKIEATNGGRNADTKVERRAGKKLVLPNSLLHKPLSRSSIFLMERPLLVLPSTLLHSVLTYFNFRNGPP